MYLKIKLCKIANDCSFEIGRISVMRACEIKRVRADLYGSPCTLVRDLVSATCMFSERNKNFLRGFHPWNTKLYLHINLSLIFN